MAAATRGRGRGRGKRSSRSTGKQPSYNIGSEDVDVQYDDKDDEYAGSANDDEYDDDQDGDNDFEGTSTRGRRKADSSTPVPVALPTRGRPSKRKSGDDLKDPKRQKLPYPVDENGSPYPIVNDEYALPEDEEGETKITKNGDLLGGRQFVVRTFTVASRGETKYMLSTEAARAVGFRDSYLFFQYHPNLYKLIISQTERDDLIKQGVLPGSSRNRIIALVTARSVFREFGAKIIVDGKNITDDYYATKLRASGTVKEGTPARETSHSNVNQHAGRTNNVHGIDIPHQLSVNPSRNAVEFFDKRNHNIPSTSNISSTNWLYQHAAACSRFNSDLFYDRERILLIENLGIRDTYTNVLHIPQSTQPTKVISMRKVKGNTNQVMYETRIKSLDLARPHTGLSDVPAAMYEDILDKDIIAAIEEQKNFEMGL